MDFPKYSKVSVQYDICQVEPQDWDQLIDPLPARSVFHSLAWLETIQCALGFKPLLVGAFREGTAVAVWPCLETWKGPFRVLGSPLPGLSTPYLGPLFAQDADIPAIVRAFFLDPTIGRSSYFACKIQDADREVGLGAVGFSEMERFETFLIDLDKPEELLWADLKSECRNRVRKAKKSGLAVRAENAGDFLDDFWEMSVGVFAKSRIKPTFTRRFLDLVWKNMHAARCLYVLSAFLKDKRVATLMLPFDKQTMYYWAGGSYSDYNKLSPANLLHWEAIIEAKRRGLRQYDFIGTKGGAGRFKKTFGPRNDTVYTHWEKSRSGFERLLKNVYKTVAHLRRMVVVPKP